MAALFLFSRMAPEFPADPRVYLPDGDGCSNRSFTVCPHPPQAVHGRLTGRPATTPPLNGFIFVPSVCAVVSVAAAVHTKRTIAGAILAAPGQAVRPRDRRIQARPAGLRHFHPGRPLFGHQPISDEKLSLPSRIFIATRPDGGRT